MLVEAPNGKLVEWRSREWMTRTDFSPDIIDPLALTLPYLSCSPRQLVLGGLGTGREAQQARARWPDIKILGLDPDPRAVRWQLENGWPPDQPPPLQLALADRHGRRPMAIDDVNCCSLHPLQLPDDGQADEVVDVETVTLDTLDRIYGPFQDCILWLDLEDYDYYAVVGGHDLLRSGRVMLINVEMRYQVLEQEGRLLEQLLADHGYERKLVWFRQWWGHNKIWGVP